MHSYLGVTGHFISSEFQLYSFLMGYYRFSGRHTALNVSLNFENAIGKFDLTEKIDFIITDNATNMIAAFYLPGFEEEQQEDDEQDGEEQILFYDEYENSVMDELPTHERCFAHSLQLVIKHALKNSETVTAPLLKVKWLSHTQIGLGYRFFTGEIRPQAANETRWNSQLKMVRSAIDKKTRFPSIC